MKKKLRRIVVDDRAYLWAFREEHVRTDSLHVDYRCHDEFVAYAEGSKSTPLRIRFITQDDPVAGGPLHYGGPLSPDAPGSSHINLNEPRWATFLIRRGIEEGWQPQAKGLTIENGLALLPENPSA